MKGICADIAAHRLTDMVSSSEDSRNWYTDSIKLLEKIDREYQGGLSGPNIQVSSIVKGDDGDVDFRFWKKGQVL